MRDLPRSSAHPIGVRDVRSTMPPPLVYDGERARPSRRPPGRELPRWVGLAVRVAVLVAMTLLVGRCTLGVVDRPRALGLSRVTRGASLSDAERVVVVLHGYGADEDDLRRLAPEVVQLGGPERTAFVFAEGPYKAGLGRAWWTTTDPAQRKDSADRVSALVDAILAKTGLPAEKVYIAGFSQGAALAIEVALLRADTLGGVVAMSPCADRAPWSTLAAGHTPVPVVIAHGKSDRVCRFSGGEGIASALAAAGHPARVVAFEGDHQISPEGERALATMLRGAPAE